MCGCGKTVVQSGPTTQEWLATPNNPEAAPRQFTDKTNANQYVAAFGGGTVREVQAGAVLEAA